MRRLIVLLPILLLTSITLTAQRRDTVRICSYNVQMIDAASEDRFDDLRTILNEIRPDILLVQDLANLGGHIMFGIEVADKLDQPLNVYAFFGENQESYSGIFVNVSAFNVIIEDIVEVTPTVFERMLLNHQYGDTLEIWIGQLQAGESAQDEAERERTAKRITDVMSRSIIPDAFEPSVNVLLGIDLKMFGSDEPAYRELAHPDTGRLVDPIGRPGWWHDNAAFADIHTGSTRVRPFGGGDTGGMNDRFNQILLSRSLMRHYLPGSYTTFGNDGRHFRDSINALPNLAVDSAMAQALHDASDHLPVYLDLVFPRVVTDVPENVEEGIERLDLSDRE